MTILNGHDDILKIMTDWWLQPIFKKKTAKWGSSSPNFSGWKFKTCLKSPPPRRWGFITLHNPSIRQIQVLHFWRNPSTPWIFRISSPKRVRSNDVCWYDSSSTVWTMNVSITSCPNAKLMCSSEKWTWCRNAAEPKVFKIKKKHQTTPSLGWCLDVLGHRMPNHPLSKEERKHHHHRGAH